MCLPFPLFLGGAGDADLRWHRHPSGRRSLRRPSPIRGGEVINRTGSNVESLQVMADVFNQVQLVDVASAGFLKPVAAGDKACFKIGFWPAPANWDSYNLTRSDKTGGTAALGLNALNDSGKATQFDDYESVGQVRNNGTQKATLVEVIGTLYDAKGTVVDCGQSYYFISENAPGRPPSAHAALSPDSRPLTPPATRSPFPPPPARPAGAPETQLELGRKGWYPPIVALKATALAAPPAVVLKIASGEGRRPWNCWRPARSLPFSSFVVLPKHDACRQLLHAPRQVQSLALAPALTRPEETRCVYFDFGQPGQPCWMLPWAQPAAAAALDPCRQPRWRRWPRLPLPNGRSATANPTATCR